MVQACVIHWRLGWHEDYEVSWNWFLRHEADDSWIVIKIILQGHESWCQVSKDGHRNRKDEDSIKSTLKQGWDNAVRDVWFDINA